MTASRPLSLRARLLLLLAAASLVAWGVAIAWSYGDARRELAALFDAQLEQSARVILAQAEHELDESDEADAAAGGHAVILDPMLERRYRQDLHVQIWDDAGRLVYQSSADLPREPVVPLGSRGAFDRTLHGERWRVLALAGDDSELEIQICQRYALRQRLAAEVARNLVVPLAAALPLLALFVWLATTAGLRPLGRFAAELAARRPGDLAPLGGVAQPAELVPLAGALDSLLGRLRERFEVERRFTADAAHELRTPLAALKTQAQVALAAGDAERREHALAQIVRGTDRMSHLVSQLLTLARLEPDAATGLEPVDLAAVARDAVGELADEAAARGVRLQVAASGETPVVGSRALLATLVRNLVENALRHGGAGGRVEVRVGAEGGTPALHVVDSGPGIAEADRVRVFDRFHRAAGSGGGAGLGLSIVERIASLHGGSAGLSTAAGGRGLDAWVRFPSAARGAAADRREPHDDPGG